MTGQQGSRIGHVETVTARAYRVPTESGPEADGTLVWNATEFVVVEISGAGHTGLGYSYTSAGAARALIESRLADAILREDIFDLPRLWLRMNDALRNAGRPGLGSMAVSALDQALWDLKSRVLQVPLALLLGRAQSCLPVYGSGGFVNSDDDTLCGQLRSWLNSGITAVKIKIGSGLSEDVRRVALARQTIGGSVELMVDANGAYDARGALALMEHLQPFRVSWFEEPVSSDNLAALRWLRNRSPAGMAIAAGEYGWGSEYFHRMLAHEAVDVLQADATRCGVTGFLQAATLCNAFSVPLSIHCAPAIQVSVGVAVPLLKHLEYFHDHVRIENLLFASGNRFDAGHLYPNIEVPGHGVSLIDEQADRYRI
ncbi:MAG: enolase C-terminal domain-like protein [Pseudohongiellaceae bacterium]